jgi:hypothetical protein
MNNRKFLHTGLVLFTMLTPLTVFADALIGCPDCDQPVSSRAVMCPHCGCPGDAIKEAAAKLVVEEAALENLSVVKVITDKTNGHAVAIMVSDQRFVVFDANLLVDASSMETLLINTNESVLYQDLQMANDSMLVRFGTDSTNLLYLSKAAPNEGEEAGSYWLMSDGGVTESATPESPDDAVAQVGSRTNIVGIIVQNNETSMVVPVPEESSWINVGPKVFLEQITLLADAERQAKSGAVSADLINRLNETVWVTDLMNREVREIVNGVAEDKP